jgi:hypothetical protein
MIYKKGLVCNRKGFISKNMTMRLILYYRFFSCSSVVFICCMGSIYKRIIGNVKWYCYNIGNEIFELGVSRLNE